MTDQTSQFFAILTNIGVAKQANADALGIAWKITQMGVGDANGTDPQPDAKQKSLIREWRRAPLNELKQDPSNPAIIIAEQVIPAEIGGNWIREIGLYDADGDLVAVANCAPSYKPTLAQGSGRTQVVRMNLIVSNTASVELKIDPSVVLATREFVLSELAKQDFKSSVMACSPGSIVLSGLQTIDGVPVPAGKRVLAPFQTAAKDRGIWVTSANAWTRATDADTNDDVTPGMLVLIEQGTLYGDSAWQLVTDAPITLGVTALTFEMAWGRTGVAAGDYRSVTVDKYGRVVAASSPTTVAGYGLTDVYTKTQLDSALAAKANLASPVLTGTPKAPTAAASTNTDQIATTAFVQQLFTALVGAAPETLNQINEIAAALGNDANFSTTIMAAMAKLAPLASPVLSGTPKAPTAAATTNTDQIATTGFVRGVLALFGIGTDSAPLVADANNAPLSGLFRMTTAGLNMPAIANATLICARYNDGGALQLFASLAGTGGYPSLFWRTQAAGGWTLWNEFAPKDSPALTGTPTAPTPSVVDSSNRIATMQALWNVLGTYNIGTLAPVALTLNANIDWAKTGGWTGFINVTASKAKGVTVPVDSGGASPAYGMWCITGRRDNSNGYTGIFTDYASGKTWTAACSVGVDGPVFTEVVRLDSPTFTGTPRAPTPATNTAGDQIVTQDFVRAWARKFIGVGVGIPGSTYVVSPTQNGCWFNITLPNAIVALPAAANVPDGTTFLFRNNAGNATVTLTVPSGNILTDVNGLTLTLGRHEMIELASSGTSYWAVNRSLMAPTARLDGPAFIGNPTAPTPAPGDASGSLATTAFVRSVTGDTVGMVAHFAMSTPPDGWLKRNGAAVSRTNYAALFAKIGTLYGAGDGSTTFNLPDSRGHFDRGWDDGRNVDAGRAFGSAQAGQNATHTHTATAANAGAHSHVSTVNLDRAPAGDGNAVFGDENYYGQGTIGTNAAGDHTHGITVAASGGNEARPINTAFLACIKY